MKKQTPLFIVLFLFTPFLMTAQSIVGDWLMDGKTPDGHTIVNKVSFNADGTLTVDLGNDGSIDVNATYTVEGNKVSMDDTSKESPCYGTVGIYEIKIEGDKCTAKVVEDACAVRKGDGKPSIMTRAK